MILAGVFSTIGWIVVALIVLGLIFGFLIGKSRG
jgi:hypothetical protein